MPVTAGGLYLLTGGLGGVGTQVAAFLLATYGVRLLVVGRTPAVGEKADQLAKLTQLGSVSYHLIDVADGHKLATMVADAELAHDQPLSGVLHLAGADPSANWDDLEAHTVAMEDKATFTAHYRAKVTGTIAIADLLTNRPSASLLLFGSVNGEFGGHAFGAYAAANAFLVGFADHWQHERGRQVRCIAWSPWAGLGINRQRSLAPAQQRGFLPLSTEEGLRCLVAAAALPYHYLLVGLDADSPAILGEVAPADLHPLEIVIAYTPGSIDPAAISSALATHLRDSPVPVRLWPTARLPLLADGTVDTAQVLRDVSAPQRRRQYLAPAPGLEQRIASIWSEVMNLDAVSSDDSFFDVGGSSLQAVRLVARMSEVLAIPVVISTLYDNPTVAALATSLSG
jgi:NAD(P)-dependent dehydrogenase (short-subunit alcohol dehydrogenase family)/acyl carrier protein